MTNVPIRIKGVFSAWNIFKLILAIVLAIFIFSKTDSASILTTIKNASLFWLAISSVFFLFLTMLKALQYYVLLRNELTYWQVLNVIIWQNAVSNFFLSGAGIATYITMSRIEHKIKISQSVFIFLLIKIADLIAIWLTLLVISNLIWPQIGVLQTPVFILLTGLGIVILIFFLTILFRQGFVSIVHRVLTRLGLSQLRVVEKGMLYLQSLADMKQDKVLNLFTLLLLCSILYLTVTVAWNYSGLATFHLQMDIMAVLFISVLLQLVSYFPIFVFGGIGITETSSLYFWGLFDVSQTALVPALIGIRVVFYLVSLIPLIYLPTYALFNRQKNKVQNEQEEF